MVGNSALSEPSILVWEKISHSDYHSRYSAKYKSATITMLVHKYKYDKIAIDIEAHFGALRSIHNYIIYCSKFDAVTKEKIDNIIITLTCEIDKRAQMNDRVINDLEKHLGIEE